MGEPRRTQTTLVQEWTNGARTQVVWHGDDVTADRLRIALEDTPAVLAEHVPDTEEYVTRRLRLGVLDLFANKEVGGPPWRWPRPVVYWRRGLVVGFGWRMTAYRLAIRWAAGAGEGEG